MKKTIWKIFYTVIYILQVAVEAVTLTALLRLDMLPSKYLIPVIGLFVLGLIVTGLFLFIPARKKSGLGRRVVACLLAAAIMALCIFALTALNQLYHTMNNITNPEDWENTGDIRQIYVLVDDPAQSLEDAADYTFGIVDNYDVQCTEGALQAIKNQLGKAVTTASFGSVLDMIDGLYGGSCRAMILNEGVLSIVEEEEGYTDVRSRIRLLCDVDVLLAQEPDAGEPQDPADEATDPPDSVADVTNTPFVMYISGLDAEGSRLYKTRSDVNILAVVNPNTKQVLLVNTPRDSFVPNPGGNGMEDKLAHCSAYGFEHSLVALSELYDVELDYYARINFTGFEKLVDAVGGVDVYSDHTYKRGEVQIVKGLNHLDGEAALVFARERKLIGGDKERGKNQMKIITAFIEKATTGTTIITNYPEILDSLGGMFVTSMDNKEISALVKMQLTDMASWDIQTYSVTGDGGWSYTYSSQNRMSWVLYLDEATVAHGSELINRVLNGEVITEADLAYPE